MANYTETDLPVDVAHGEMVTLNDGTVLRFESNGEAKDIMIGESFSPATTLFPGNEFCVDLGAGRYCMTCEFGDVMNIRRA